MDDLFQDGMTVMVGGFGGAGVPVGLISALAESGVRDLTIVTNDTGVEAVGVGRLIGSGTVARLVCSYVGQNRHVEERLNDIDIELVPQGLLAERIRAAGAGLEGIVSKIRGRRQFEPAIRADVALIRGDIVDLRRNVYCGGTNKNFNPVMATAADVVIVQADKAISGYLECEQITIPGIYIDAVHGG